ncbi:salicylate synthase [Amycolatopsis sp. EV170708-02-1]|uniref:salicylate synthase n=1 Tax=Amycolatopsis sp. EV170708-02-1 TaxID=2919322 RepID=UPI001F0C6B52|nr:salicylate synthase [Amycolatopsis sp. EV170708-02-1]UMP06851.1 salicylate synthase [Amycolatopsis sp. EV170708-02-1]
MTVERRISFESDGVEVAAALAAGSVEPHVVYEGKDSVCWAEGEFAVVSVRGSGATLIEDGKRTDFPLRQPQAALAEVLGAIAMPEWRAYGWISFEWSHLLHGGVPSESGGPLVYLAVPRREIRFVDGAATLRAANESELDDLDARLSRAVAASGTTTAPDLVMIDEREDLSGYREAVAQAVSEIRAGSLDKVILSRVVPVEEDLDFPATYVAGRKGNAPARSFLLRLGGWEAAGFSPEIVAAVGAEGAVRTQPLAGTRAFDGDSVLDVARREELYRDAKEVFEHAISVRLAAMEMAGVCAPGTVHVADFMSVKERGSVQHLASDVAGTLMGDRTAWDALGALFPAVTASGIPKASACEAIGRIEPSGRGLYSGAVLTIDSAGELDAALVLRSVFRRDGRTWLRAGAGIVADSTPNREFEETVEKLRSVSRFLVPSAPALTAAAAR